MSKYAEALDKIQKERNNEGVFIKPTLAAMDKPVLRAFLPDKVTLWILIGCVIVLAAYAIGFGQGVELTKSQVLQETHPVEAVTVISENVREPAQVSTSAVRKSAIFDQTTDGVSDQSVEMAKPPAAELDEFYTIQLAIYTHERYALREAQKLNQDGYMAFVNPRGRFFELCVEQFSAENQAREKLIELRHGAFQRLYGDAFVKSVRR